MKRVLFICGRNRLRSPTAERVFAGHPEVETASAGLNRDCENPVTAELLRWADLVFVMDKSNRRRLTSRFRAHLGAKRVICLDVPDNHEYMAPALVELLRVRVTPHLARSRARETRGGGARLNAAGQSLED